jgi:serine/threonine protein kinase
MRRIDAACLRVERAWKDGGSPRIEDELAAADRVDHPDLLAELLPLEWLYRRQRGEAVDRNDYRARFATLAVDIDQLWGRWQEEQGLSPETAVPADPATHDSDADQPGFAVPAGYENLEPLGQGGMGVVWKAYQRGPDRWVALKRLHLEQITPERLHRFRNEAKALARFQHPHIVGLFDFLENSGQPVLVMEHVRGGTLEQRLDRPLPPAEAARLVLVLAWALHAAHEKNIVHRDLKPANVLLGDPVPGNASNVLGGFPKISDFGLASLAGEGPGQTIPGAVFGTPAYMSPEQARGQTDQVGPPADVWALGVILYRCLTGVLPFRGGTALETLELVKVGAYDPPGKLCPELPAALAELCGRCLEKSPAARPTAAELAGKLDQFLAGGQEGQPGPSPDLSPTVPLPPVVGPWARQRVLLGGIAVGVLAVLASGWGLWSWSKDDTVRIVTFRVRHLRIVDGKQTEDHGEIGKESFEPRFGDLAVVEVELSRQAYLYLVALNTDGKEQLLWPADRRDPSQGDPRAAPDRLQRLTYPPPNPETGRPCGVPLDDNVMGGLQAFAVLVSASPLPAYGDYVKARGAAGWRQWPGGKGVWLGDRKGVYEARRGLGVVRGKAVELPGVPPLMSLARKLEATGVEQAEVLAFPVQAKEGN